MGQSALDPPVVPLDGGSLHQLQRETSPKTLNLNHVHCVQWYCKLYVHCTVYVHRVTVRRTYVRSTPGHCMYNIWLVQFTHYVRFRGQCIMGEFATLCMQGLTIYNLLVPENYIICSLHCPVMPIQYVPASVYAPYYFYEIVLNLIKMFWKLDEKKNWNFWWNVLEH